MKYNQNYTYQNINGIGRNCEDRWEVISKFITKANPKVLDVGSAEGYFSKKISNEFDANIISIEASDFVYNEQKKYCESEIQNGKIILHKTELNRESIQNFLNVKYDYTFLLSVLHWCDEPDYLLKKLSEKSEVLFIELPDLSDTKSYGQDYLSRIKNTFGNLENYLQEITEKPIIGAYKVAGNNSEYRVIYVLKSYENVEMVDVSDVYHLLHGDEQKIEYSYINGSFKCVPIHQSPVTKYLNGETNEYRNQPKLFYKREDTIHFLTQQFESGDRDWIFKAVLYKGKYIISDGMHRSSVLYKNRYRKIFVEVVSGSTDRTATFERYIKDENFVEDETYYENSSYINDGHYLELMDRLHIIIDTLETHCVNHPLSEKDTDIQFHIKYAMGQLMDAYQMIGKKMPK